MRVSYFLHQVIEGINKDVSDIEWNFLEEDREPVEGVGTGGDQEAIAFPFLPHSQDGIRPEHWLDGLGAMG